MKLNKKTDFFTRFPNEYIQDNIQNAYGVNRKFYIIYLLISKYQSYEGYSWLPIREIYRFYGKDGKSLRKTSRLYIDIKKTLEYMSNCKMISFEQDLDKLNLDTVIKIDVNSSTFDCDEYFSAVTSSQLDFIMNTDVDLPRESLLMTFLYVNSYIINRPKNSDGSEVMYDPETKPETFWRSINSMVTLLKLSKRDVIDCLTCLSFSNNSPLVKAEVGNIYNDETQIPKKLPNIYVLNKDGYEKEIEWSLDYIYRNIKKS